MGLCGDRARVDGLISFSYSRGGLRAGAARDEAMELLAQHQGNCERCIAQQDAPWELSLTPPAIRRHPSLPGCCA